MKKIKYIISLILIAIVFGFIGEIYVWHVDSFESTYTNVTMYLQKETSQEEMIEDIYHAAEKENVEIFTIDQEIENIFSTTRIIYGTEGVKSHLSDMSKINPGHFQSVFLGNVQVKFKPLEEIDDLSQIELYHVIGDKEDILEFKRDLVNQYAGRFPQEGSDSHENLFIVMAIWGVSLLFLLLMTLYEVALVKKEVMIRIICGESLIHFVNKNILVDLAVYVVMFTTIPFTLNRFTTATYYMNVSITGIIIFLLLNSMIYLSLYFTDYKKDMGSKESSKSVLNVSYIYKVISIVSVIIVMSGCIELIHQGADYYRQKNFFEEHKGYAYIGFGSLHDDIEAIYADAYQQFSEEGKVFSLVNLETFGETNTEYILANSAAIEYLQANILDIENFSFKEKIYFIIPDKLVANQRINEEVHDIWSSYYKGEYDDEFVPYKENVEIINMKNSGKISTGLMKNPIIILNNMKNYDKYWNSTYIGNSSLFKISDKEWSSFISKHGLENEMYYQTNAYDYYMHQWQLLKRNMFIGIVLFAVLIMLESMIIRTIISYEYRVSAMEIALKKVLGYKLFERHKKILLTTLIFGIISVLAATLIFYFIGEAFTYILLAGICMLVIEMVIVCFYINKTDKMNIQKILKGGTL
ncbi:hypothetical protein DCC39_08370 [Pueribacillus theae]|uniref:DUF1430 domain-containing protein n=1 Tax=Pueribacillus theae TaxID=2171751 RepID=A0A2U1K335_9BACI|nr:DUF1430 domain-containing protein [Pueribacillus theae]PWA11940.1 hypothetical protein DCC39_08370 [Pueribacillus theae]